MTTISAEAASPFGNDPLEPYIAALIVVGVIVFAVLLRVVFFGL